jgi:hypothetical protein
VTTCKQLLKHAQKFRPGDGERDCTNVRRQDDGSSRRADEAATSVRANREGSGAWASLSGCRPCRYHGHVELGPLRVRTPGVNQALTRPLRTLYR